jgi:hypothetical protein
MQSPVALAISSSGSLFVVDRDLNRVLRFDNAASLSNGAFANGVLGQNNFLASGPGLTQSTLSTPYGTALDSNNNLWVSDFFNNRILRFDNAVAAANGAPASAVIGQTKFNTNSSGTTSQTLWGPIGLALDNLGHLYASDYNNNRVLVFLNPSSINLGATASFVIGQATFTTNANTPVSASSLNSPFGLSYSTQGYLWVMDAGNNRALSYSIIPGSPQIKTSPVKPFAYAGKSRRFSVKVIDNSTASDVFTLKLSIPKGTTNRSSLRFFIGGLDVTGQLKSGSYQTPVLAAGETFPISVQVKPRTSAHGTLTFSLTATSGTNSANTTTSKVNITIR